MADVKIIKICLHINKRMLLYLNFKIFIKNNIKS